MADEIREESIQETLHKLEEEKLKIKRTMLLVALALVAVFALAIAWFVANDTVSGDTSNISADKNTPIILATKGSRQTAEQNFYKEEVNGEYRNILVDGTTQTYNDVEYYTGYNLLALRLDKQIKLQPGAGGRIDFYIIAKERGISQANISLEIKGYKGETRAIPLDTNVNEEKKLQNLLEGHLLLFKKLDDVKGYSGWIQNGEGFTVKASDYEEDNSFEVGKPYKVSFYWKWPQYFRNYIYNNRSNNDDLFGEGGSATELISFISENKNLIKSDAGKLFYTTVESPAGFDVDLNNTINDETLNRCNTYYNAADEYIGNNVKFVLVQVRVN